MKKIFNRLFHDVYVSLEFTTNKSLGKKNILSILTPNNFHFFRNRSFKSCFKRNKKKTILENCVLKQNPLDKLLKTLIRFSVFGETIRILYIKKTYSLNSSAVEQRTENPCVNSSNLFLDKNKLTMKNYLWNMFANIKNGQMAGHNIIFQRRKKICEAFLKINKNKPAINSVKFLSKPSRRLYYSIKQIWKIDSNKSFIIFSTNRGLKSILECKKLRIGGEPFIVIN